jgi:formyltetrahydrofolate hydrolase
MRQAAKQRWLKRSRRSERRLLVWLARLAHCIENFLQTNELTELACDVATKMAESIKTSIATAGEA